LVLASLAASGYIFLLRPSTEAPPQPTRQSIADRRQKQTPPKAAPKKAPVVPPKEATAKSPLEETTRVTIAKTASDAAVSEAQAAKRLTRAEGLPTTPGGYTVQILASEDREAAEDLASRIISGGYKAYSQEVQLPGKGLFYRVRVGAYPSRWEARAAMAEIVHKYDLEAWIDYYIPPAPGSGRASIRHRDNDLVSEEAEKETELIKGRSMATAAPAEEPAFVPTKTEVSPGATEAKIAKVEGETSADLASLSGSAGEEVTAARPAPSSVREETPPISAPRRAEDQRVKQTPPAKIEEIGSRDSEASPPQEVLAVKERSNSRAQRYSSKGISYQRQGKLESAVESYKKALTSDPDHDEARLNLATALMQMGRLKEAEQELTRLYAKSPGDPRILYNLGLLLYRFGEYTSAESKLQEVLESDPLHLEAHLLLSNIYQAWEEHTKALEFCMNAYRINSADPRVLYRLGRMMDQAGELEGAVKYYRLFLKTGSEEESGARLAVRDRLNYLISQKGGAE
jgi:tetratricopeptide (TPR) repeat protein